MGKQIEVWWLNKSARDYVDILPVEDFSKLKHRRHYSHAMRGPRGKITAVVCHLSVSRRSALLDYTAPEDKARNVEWYPGSLRLVFFDAKRDRVQKVFWSDEGKPFKEVRLHKDNGKGQRISGIAVYVSTQSQTGHSLSYKPKPNIKKRIKRQVLARIGQADFRTALMNVYRSRCCITGSKILLEAAHIDPYAGSGSNEISNGLLMRCDMHALFDAAHLAIDPKTGKVHLSKEALAVRDYAKFHKRELRLNTDKTLQPSPALLAARWDYFIKKHGKKPVAGY